MFDSRSNRFEEHLNVFDIHRPKAFIRTTSLKKSGQNTTKFPDYLQHYGIPHMKWGFRRFQYENGRLTPEGKERYRKQEGGTNKLSRDYNKETRKLNHLERNMDIDYQRGKQREHQHIARAAGQGALVAATLAGAKQLKMTYGRHIGPLDAAGRNLSAAVAVAFGAYSGAHAIAAKVAGMRVTDIGHQKAVEKYQQQYDKMLRQFADTPYEQLIKNKTEKASESERSGSAKDFSSISKEERDKLNAEGKQQAAKEFEELEKIKDPDERSKRAESMLEYAYKALGPYSDSTYPGYDDRKDPKQQSYDIELCKRIDKKVKGICDPLGLDGEHSDSMEGRTPRTKAVIARMKEIEKKEDAIYDEVVRNYKEKHHRDKLSDSDFTKILNIVNSKTIDLKKQWSKASLHELTAAVLKDLGIPDTPNNEGYIYPFLYYDSFL